MIPFIHKNVIIVSFLIFNILALTSLSSNELNHSCHLLDLKVMQFPQVRQGGEVFQDVLVEFFEIEADKTEVSDHLWQRINKGEKVDKSRFPLMPVVGRILLQEAHNKACWVITVYDLDLISVTEASVSKTMPKFVQELALPGKRQFLIRSSEIALLLKRVIKTLAKDD